MIKLRITFDEKPIPGFLTESNWEQLAELCQLFGFPANGVLVQPKSLPDSAWSPLRKALSQKGVRTVPVHFSLSKHPTLREAGALADALPIQSTAKHTFFLLGGVRFLASVDFVLNLLRKPPRVVHIPTSLVAQAEFPFWKNTCVSSARAVYPFSLKVQRRELLWLSTDVLATLPESHFLLGLLSFLRLSVLFDRQLFLFLEDKAPRLTRDHSDVLIQALFKTYKIKTDVLLPTEFHSLLEKWYQNALLALKSPEAESGTISSAELLGIDFLLRLKMSAELEESDPAELKRVQAVFRSLGLPKLFSNSVWQEMMSKLENLPEANFPQEWVLLRGIGKASVRTGLKKTDVLNALTKVAEDEG